MTDGKSPARQKQLSGVLDALAASFNVEVLTITPDQISRYLSARRVKEWSKRNHSDVIGDGSKHLGAIGLTMPDPLPDTVNTGLRSTVNWEEDNRSGQPDDLGAMPPVSYYPFRPLVEAATTISAG